ncbi:MAG: M23 family metallopeptidase [Candidatus Marinimicrobia bacterium]|nr:M23 family metallopeptidase [Candidatus Neomarinimicrobiota bacterium]
MLLLCIIFAQILYSSPYLTQEMKSSVKKLLNYEDIAVTIEDEAEKAEFYNVVAEEIMSKTKKLKTVYAQKFRNYEIQIEEFCKVNNLENIELEVSDDFQINYEYKMVELSKETLKKQFHYKQVKVMKNQFIKGYKLYRAIESNYKKRIQELDKQILKLAENSEQITQTQESTIDNSVRELPQFFNKYIWPCNSGEYITGVFGEFRERWFHAGLDIRTFGKIGFEVYAIENGYLERIRTSSKGYGKALYIRLEDGNIAVYVHLDSFKPTFNQIAKFIQNKENSYTIDHYFEPYEYPVKKGEIIGYTGDTGGISGPHLHFEIRDESNHPLNPFLTNLNIIDTKLPIPQSLAIIPIEKQTLIDGFPQTKIVEILKNNDSNYHISDTISVQGDFGLAIQIKDKIDKQSFDFGLYGMNLFVDDELIYNTQFNIFDFEENSSFYDHRDYMLRRENKGKFYRLFSENPSQMSFIDEASRQIPNLESGYHRFLIEAWDFSQNLVSISGVISLSSVPDVSFALTPSGKQINVTTYSEEPIHTNITLLTPYDDNHTLNPIITTIENGILTFENSNHLYKVVEVIGNASSGLQSKSQYFSISSNQVLNPKTTPKIMHYQHGIILEFHEHEFSGRNADLLLDNFDTLRKFPLERSSKNVLSSQVFSPAELSEFTEYSIRYLGEPDLVYKSNLYSQLTIPNRSFELSFDDDKITVSGDGDTFSDTTLVWINKVSSPTLPEGKMVLGPYFIGPDLIPYSDKIKITFNVQGLVSESQNAGIFYYDTKKEKWYYMETEKLDNFYSTTALSGEIFAVISEDTKPELIDLIPDIGGTYNNLSSLSFFVKDSFSGIDGENNVTITVDGQKIIHEYVSYRNLVSYEFDDNLPIGTHLLTIEARDNVGNVNQISSTFFVK